MSASELGEWADHFSQHSFSDTLLDAEFSTLKSLMVALVSGEKAAAADFSLMPEPEPSFEKNDDEMMFAGEGIYGGIRYGPGGQPRL